MAASAGAWYRVGTVSVTNNNAAIVGVGSNWQNDVIAIAIGDAFTIDAKTWYEVIAVNSDTSITLDRGFEGSTASDVEYAILRNTSGTILTRIAGQIAVQFNQKQLFLDELRNWLTSEDETATLTDSHGIAHVVKTVNKIQELVGTAADTDKVTNSVDTTPGRLTSVGWGGIGGARLSKQMYGNDLLNLAAENGYNGWIVEVSVDTANKPPMGPNNLAGHIIRVQNTLLLIASYPFTEEGSIYIGYWDGSEIDWRKQYDSGNTGTAVTADVTTSSTDTTAGRVLTVGDFGLGGSAPLLADLDDTTVKSGLYSVTSETANSVINGSQINGFVLVQSRAVNARKFYICCDEGATSRMYSRVYNTGISGGFTGWNTLYHSGNTNFNEFGGIAENKVLATGVMFTSTTARFYLPINSKVQPSSITTVGGFRVVTSQTIIATEASVSMSFPTSERMVVLDVTVPSTAIGTPVNLRGETATSKITVNF